MKDNKTTGWLFGAMLPAIVIFFFAGCGESYDPDPVWPPEPENGEGYGVLSEEVMVSAAHPLVVEAGLSVLEAGGNAIDAAVAVQMVLNVVEPPESGIGGGAFLLFRDGVTGRLTVFDGRETAPAAATGDRFMVGHWPIPLWAAIPTGLAVGVPGTLAMLHEAHAGHGTMAWQDLFDPAITLARDGFPMPDRLKRQVELDPSLWLFGDIRRHLVHPRRDDEPVLQNPELAQTFQHIAREGPDYFYRGELTGQMIEAARGRWPGRSDLTPEDFDNYRPVVREAICRDYRSWTICGVPAPSSGGITLLQILGILEHFDLPGFAPGDPQAIHLVAEASRLAFADRSAWIGDPDFTAIPQNELLNPEYLRRRAAWIDTDRAMEEVNPGIPNPATVSVAVAATDSVSQSASVPVQDSHFVPFSFSVPALDAAISDVSSYASIRQAMSNKVAGMTEWNGPVSYDRETTGTSHFSIVDRHGNAVAMTTSIEAPFGSRIMTNGFLLNNQLTDFTFQADQNGFRSPNAVEPGKRPRSSMAPIMVFDEEGELRLVIGSRGGSRIIGYVVKTLIGVLDWDLPVQDAIAMPNFLHRGRFLELEEGTAWSGHADSLKQMGHHVRVRPLESGIHGIERVYRDGWYWQGGADPRMDGVALGQ